MSPKASLVILVIMVTSIKTEVISNGVNVPDKFFRMTSREMFMSKITTPAISTTWTTYRDEVVQMQRPVHLEVGHGHDDGMHEVGTIGEPAERLEQATGQR